LGGGLRGDPAGAHAAPSRPARRAGVLTPTEAYGPHRMEHYLIAMATFGCLYALLALGLNLVWGMAGMINLGLVGFFAFGAFVSALGTRGGGGARPARH